MNKIRKGDEVIVRTGKDKGRRGTVLEIFDDERILIEGVNLAKQGGILDKAMPLDISNVLVFNPKSKKGERVGIRVNDDGSKERIFRGTGEVVDI